MSWSSSLLCYLDDKTIFTLNDLDFILRTFAFQYIFNYENILINFQRTFVSEATSYYCHPKKKGMKKQFQGSVFGLKNYLDKISRLLVSGHLCLT